jgi:SAM-dependent methyltransferase
MDDPVSKTYTEDYFLERCGGVEFFKKFGADVLKPMMQIAVNKAALKPGMKILDVGCGRGELTAHLQARGHDIVGIDGSSDAIKVAKTNFPNASFIAGDLFAVKFPAASFDRVFFLGIIEHLTDAEITGFLAEFERILKPGGRVIITTCTNSLYNKKLTYRLRGALATLFHLKAPTPPRSDEDELMHINEQNYYSLPKHARGRWAIEVQPRFNPKLEVDDIYGKNAPTGLPIRRASAAKTFFFRVVAGIPFLKILFSRANVMVLTKTGV